MGKRGQCDKMRKKTFFIYIFGSFVRCEIGLNVILSVFSLES